jgi:hypothetical protein
MLARRLPAMRASLRSLAQQSRSASAITLNSDHTLNVSHLAKQLLGRC